MSLRGKNDDVVGVDNDDDDDDDDAMKTLLPLVASFFAVGAFAHEGHGATPVHVHTGVFAFDIGAAVAAIVVGSALVLLARRRAR